jgi:hypothetical protein
MGILGVLRLINILKLCALSFYTAKAPFKQVEVLSITCEDAPNSLAKLTTLRHSLASASVMPCIVYMNMSINRDMVGAESGPLKPQMKVTNLYLWLSPQVWALPYCRQGWMIADELTKDK